MSTPHYFTKKEDVTSTVEIWARTRPQYEIIEDGKEPFYYELRTDKCWADDAVKVAEFPVTLQVPAGIDLLAATIETLKERKQDVLARAQREATKLQEKINGLLMLAYQPDPITGDAPTVIPSEDHDPYDDIPF